MSAERSNRVTVNAAFFREIKEDHQQLQKLLSDIDQLIENRVYLSNHPQKFVTLIDQLVDQLGLHFTLEEAYGYFEISVVEAPRLHDSAVRLRDQHTELYTILGKIADTAGEESLKPEPQMNVPADQFVAFHAAFKAHESAELNLILEAANRDVGCGD